MLNIAHRRSIAAVFWMAFYGMLIGSFWFGAYCVGPSLRSFQ